MTRQIAAACGAHQGAVLFGVPMQATGWPFVMGGVVTT
jgi:hypothetical protein